MPIFGRPAPQPPATPPVADDYDLATPEETAARQRRRRLVAWGSVVVVLLVALVVVGRPARRSIKVWQARRAAAEAMRLLDNGQAEAAVGKVQDALQLRGTDLEVMRTAAIFLTRIGHGREAVTFWKEIEGRRKLTRDEQRGYATNLLEGGNLNEARRRLELAGPAGSSDDPRDWWLGMQIATRGRDATGAVRLARRLLDDKAPGVTTRQRFDAALLLLNVNDPEGQRLGAATLQTLAAGDRSPESLEALLALTRQAAQSIGAARSQGREVPEAAVTTLLDLAGRIEAHPLAQTGSKLLAAQGRVVAQPERRTASLQEAVDRYGHGTDADAATLGGWLYAQGEFARVLALIPPERAVRTRALYLQYLDTLGALGRWSDIRQAIEGQKFTLDPLVEEMYLARCAKQLRQPEGASTHWAAALRVAGTNPDKLLVLGRYALTDGELPTGEAAYRAAIKAVSNNRAAHEALLGLLETQGRTQEARVAIRDMLAVWPGDTAVRNDDAYLSALLGEDLPAARDAARDLVRLEPTSLPHRITLALAELRLGHDLTALETLRMVNAPAFAAQARFQAVYGAVLQRSGFGDEARQAVAALPRNRLLPEEAQLLESVGIDAPAAKPAAEP